LGGTVFTFPRSKIVMTSPMDVPLHGKVKLSETSKTELLSFWTSVLEKNTIVIRQNTKVEAIVPDKEHFRVETLDGEQFTTCAVLLSIGRRGTPRKLGVPGETLEKVAYRLLEPEDIMGKNIMVVGGGDSAIESALLLADQNKVTLTYRSETFSRIKPKNSTKINEAIAAGTVNVMFNTNPVRIEKDFITVTSGPDQKELEIINDLIFIFAGGELPIQFLQKVGIIITKKFGEVVLKHR
jgi:thioredoxin reductase (NADPH)